MANLIIIISIFVFVFGISLLPFIRCLVRGDYAFFSQHNAIKEMDRSPGVWGYSTSNINIWEYIDARRKGMIHKDYALSQEDDEK